MAWGSSKSKQSTLEWLYFKESKLDGDNKIKFVRNGGEQRMLTAAESYFVDGFNPTTNTVYEFHGCYYHGCVKCFKNSRHQSRNCHIDRSVDKVYQATVGTCVGTCAEKSWEKKSSETDVEQVRLLTLSAFKPLWNDLHLHTPMQIRFIS